MGVGEGVGVGLGVGVKVGVGVLVGAGDGNIDAAVKILFVDCAVSLKNAWVN